MTIFLLIVGLLFSIAGAEALVKGASKLAATLGMSPLVIGLTVVAYGTSMPEVSVSVISSFNGQADVAVGNVVGSNIFNVLFILGLSSLILPLTVSQQLIRLDVPIMIAASVWIYFIGYDGRISRFDGMILFLFIIFYTFFLLYFGSKKNIEIDKCDINSIKRDTHSSSAIIFNISLIFLGLILLVVGSRWLIFAAVSIAQFFGISELVIGLTLIAAGTSLPEVVTSVLASLRGERDIAVGNVIGSNIFNLFAVLGMSSIVASEGLSVSSPIIQFDIPVMIAVAFVCLPIFLTGFVIARWEGALFLAYYIAYMLYVVLAAIQHDSLTAFSTTMLWFVLPLTALTIIIVTVHSALLHKQI